MNDIDLDRYFKNHELRADLEAQARRERAQAVGKLLVAAVRWLARLPAQRVPIARRFMSDYTAKVPACFMLLSLNPV